VHAAGVIDPRHRAWLLVGPTGSGKSTLAYALARKGWAVLGDDGVIVEVQQQGVVAMGWREPLRVSRTLAHAFPELSSEDTNARAIPGDARQRAEFTLPAAPRGLVAALVWIQQGPVDQLTPLSPTQALVDLVRESAWVLIADGGAAAHLAALRRIVTEVPSFRLTHSPAQLRTIQDTLLSARP
jgi:energy-coupling factor transporter ATP-binding protein EcfA2